MVRVVLLLPMLDSLTSLLACFLGIAAQKWLSMVKANIFALLKEQRK